MEKDKAKIQNNKENNKESQFIPGKTLKLVSNKEEMYENLFEEKEKMNNFKQLNYLFPSVEKKKLIQIFEQNERDVPKSILSIKSTIFGEKPEERKKNGKKRNFNDLLKTIHTEKPQDNQITNERFQEEKEKAEPEKNINSQVYPSSVAHQEDKTHHIQKKSTEEKDKEMKVESQEEKKEDSNMNDEQTSSMIQKEKEAEKTDIPIQGAQSEIIVGTKTTVDHSNNNTNINSSIVVEDEKIAQEVHAGQRESTDNHPLLKNIIDNMMIQLKQLKNKEELKCFLREKIFFNPVSYESLVDKAKEYKNADSENKKITKEISEKYTILEKVKTDNKKCEELIEETNNSIGNLTGIFTEEKIKSMKKKHSLEAYQSKYL